MARGRMISRSLGESDRFAELNTHAQRMLYMMLVTHADCEGRLKGNTRWIAGKVLTYLDYPESEIEVALRRMDAVHLIRLYTVDGKRYIQIEKFHEHNTVRRGKDGQPTHESPSDIPPAPQRDDVATTEPLRIDDVVATAEVEVEVEVQDEVEVKENPQTASVLPDSDIQPLRRLRKTDPEAHKMVEIQGGQLGWKFRHKNLAAQQVLENRDQALAALQSTLKGANKTGASAYTYFERVLSNPKTEPGERVYEDIDGGDLLGIGTLNGKWGPS